METIEIRTEEGILKGEAKSQCLIFRGVRYAEAPVGDRRFRAPNRILPFKGVYDATEFRAQCPQADPTSGFYGKEFYTDEKYPLPEQSEDCLFLNIWAPRKPGKYPVAFWIHGGAFDHGFSSEMEFDGEKFAGEDVILVTVNYRVGVFGFFADDSLRRENTFRTTGNYGLLDQITALQWVYRNIAHFNGDPERITIFGQSAGAMSVQALISSPLSHGLIHSAIMQSGGGINNGLAKTLKMDDALAVSKKVMELCGVKTAQAMRNVPAEKLVEILPELYQHFQGLAFGPVIDGYVLRESTDDAALKGNIYDIPYMIGMTSNDITIEKGANGRKSKFFEGCINFLETRCEKSRMPVYMYYFQRQLPGDDAGAFHSSELWYVFGTLGRCWRPFNRHDYQLSNQMVEAWCNFIKTDHPGAPWKPYTRKEQFIRTFM